MKKMNNSWTFVLVLVEGMHIIYFWSQFYLVAISAFIHMPITTNIAICMVYC